jgi:ElaB/YqjD/DUF883 family membrane-anchored ribosome-binding protein
MSQTSTTAADQIGDAANRAATRVSNSAHEVEDALKRNLEQSKEKLSEAVDVAASRVEDAHAFVTRHAREKPVQTTAIAVGAGLLLGMFLASGRRR